MKISIELDVFSGRQNPSWTLENEAAEKLGDMLQNLPPSKTPVPLSRLGYNGFVLTIYNGDKKEKIQVFNNKIMVGADSAKSFDDEYGLEKKLLQMAKEKGYANELDSIGL